MKPWISALVKKLTLAIGLGTFVAVGIWLYAQSPAPNSKQKRNDCSNPQPCSELRLPPEVGNSPAQLVSDAKGDFQALNLGYEVDLSWKKQPLSAERVILYRSTSPNGPWKKVIDISASALPKGSTKNSISDIWIDGTLNDLYYRLEIRGSSRKVLKTYGTLRVPKRSGGQ